MSIILTEPGYILPQAMEDVDVDAILVAKEKLDADNIDITLMLLEAIEENKTADILDILNNAPATDAPSPVQREGFTQANVVKKNPFALHYAARDGDVEKMNKLVEAGYDVNFEDKKSARPLHYAALRGNMAAVKYLIAKNSEVDDIAYEGNTALHFALKKQHYDVAYELIFKGKANPYATNAAGISPLSYLVKDLSNRANILQDGESVEAIKILLKALLNFAMQGDATHIISEGCTVKNGVKFVAQSPLATELLLLAANASSKELQKVLLDGVASIEAHNTSHQSYLQALNLLHRFPTGGMYDLSLSKDKSMPLVSEGHYALFTTEFARDSLAAFLATIPDSVELSTHKEIFKSVYEIYVNAALFCQHKYQDATYSQALALYHEGKTVLLPSGWAGHFVDVILSKIQQMYVVANSGDRYTGESAQDDFEMEPGDQAGLNFYRLEEVDKLNEKFIRNTLHNDSKMNLELEQPMKFGMLESLFNIENPDQEYGNCGWESHRDAVEGILLIELLNRDVPFEQAKDQAKHMYESWDLFHGNYAIDKYMDNNPGLPVEALMEILLNLQPKKKEQISDSMNLENKDNAQNVSDKHPKIDYSEIKNDIHAKKIIETLQSDTYKEAFKDFINTLDLDDENIQNLMHDLKECYQVDVDALLSDATQIHSTALPVTQGNVTETFSEAAQDSQPTSAHFDIGHQLMVPCFLNAEIV